MKRNAMLSLMLALALAISAVMAGCANGGKKLAAKVGDQEITVAQIETAYQNNASYAMYYGFSLDSAEGVEAYQDYIVNEMITSRLKAYKARQAGLTLTDEEQAEAKATADKNYNDTYQQFLDSAQQSGSSDPKAYANSQFAKALSANNTSVGQLKKDMLQDAEDAILVEKHKDQLLEGAAPTAETLKADYEKEQAAEQTAFDADPTQYFTYVASASYGYGFDPLYVPAGLFYVRQILVDDEDTAKEVKAKIDAGEDFEALLTQYNTDTGMNAEANAEGYVVGKGASYVEPFLTAALALEKEGDVSDIVKSDYGYHIIKRMKDKTPGPIPYEQVQQKYDEYMTNSALSTRYSEILNEWLEDDTVVTRYPENYRYIGKSDLPEATPTPEPTAEAAATAEVPAE